MATLVKRNGSPYWWLQFRAGKRWTKRSLHLRIDVSADTRKARQECAKQTLKEVTGRTDRKTSVWEAWVPRFFEQRYATMPATRKRYETAWRTWLLFFDQHEIRSPADVTYEHCLAFLTWRQNANTTGVYRCGRNTAIYEIKVLGTIFQEAIRLGFITVNPARSLGLVKIKPKEKSEITPAEEAIIRKELPNWPEWMRVAFEIAMAIGCRLRETAIDFRNIDFDNRVISFQQKGGRLHTTALPPHLIPMLKEIKASGQKRTCELPYMPSKEWWRFFKHVGLSHLSFHSTRVTVVTRLARAGIPERHTMRFVGHASSTIHRVYTRLKVDDLQMCIEALKPSVAADSVVDGVHGDGQPVTEAA